PNTPAHLPGPALEIRRCTMRRRLPAAFLGAGLALLVVAGPTLACGGLIGPNGAVNLLRTTTLAAYHNGVEHYVTAFQFAGGGGAFGSITPLPGVPSSVVRGGDWTLQPLVRETNPPTPAPFAASAAARGQAVGDGTPVHITIPTDNPWVPLRILALGKAATETVQADVYLLTDRKPAMLPDPSGLLAARGIRLTHSAPATDSLLTDL